MFPTNWPNMICIGLMEIKVWHFDCLPFSSVLLQYFKQYFNPVGGGADVLEREVLFENLTSKRGANYALLQ